MIEEGTRTTTDLVSEVRVRARPDTIFPFLVDAERMIQWIGSEATLDARPGGEVSILVAGKHRARGEYVEIDPPRCVVMTFGWEDPASNLPPGSTRLQFDLIPDGAETLVRLTHSGLPESHRGDHQHGWDHYVERLRARASGGDFVPDPWAAGAPASS